MASSDPARAGKGSGAINKCHTHSSDKAVDSSCTQVLENTSNLLTLTLLISIPVPTATDKLSNYELPKQKQNKKLKGEGIRFLITPIISV